MTTSPERRRYVVGCYKIAPELRDVAHAVLTEDDDRGFFPIDGALDDTDDYLTAPIGAPVSYRVELTDAEADRFRRASNCRYVELDGTYRPTAVDVPRPASLAFMEANFPAAASTWHGGGVAVAILDSGTTTAMRAAAGISLGGKATFINDGPPAQSAGQTTGSHGSAVAACGVPPGGVVYDVVVVDNAGGISSSNIAAGINWAVAQGVRVINGSFGGPGAETVVSDALAAARTAGAQCFFATGNAGSNTMDYPAAFSTTFANVHSSISFDETTGLRASSSNFSANASGCAPGENVAILTPTGTVGTASGTSLSSPHMASLCARGMTGGRFTANQVGAALKANTRPTGQPVAQQGGGAYSLNRALAALGAFIVSPTQFPYAAVYPDGVAYPTIAAGTTTINVSTSSALITALANATPGQRILLANGTYSGAFAVTSKTGTSTAGISIEAASTGGAVFASGSTFNINNSAYVTLKGLAFPYELASGNTVQFRGSSNRCRVTRCLFGPTSVGTVGANKTPFVYLGDNVEHIRIDHNEFRNKANPGNTILGDGNFTTFQAVRHIRIDHNVLRSIKPEVDNEKEPIRLGVSTMSKTASNSVIERNFFLDCICEPEIISVKCDNVRVSGNTVLRSIGGIVYRHGRNGVVTDNHIVDRVQTFGTTIGSGGLRGYDSGHEFSHNYVDGVYGGNFQNALMLDSGDAEGSSTNLAGHWRVVNWLVERNVLVGNPTGIVIGHNYSSAPTGCTIRDNVVAQSPTGTAITQKIAPVSTTVTGNLYGATPGAVSLAQGPDTIWRRVGYGPRLTYLQQADVGITGDVNDTDGTGTLIGAGGTGGTVDTTTAAGRHGWGQPLDVSDEFSYTGAPNSSKWSVPGTDWAGHAGNGRRRPERQTVDGSTLVMTGLANGDSGWMAHKLNQQYGRWEVRMRSYPNAASNGNDYHPVLIIWPESDEWPEDGEYDFVENSVPGDNKLGAFIHFPHNADVAVQQRYFEKTGVDMAQFHNFAIEWTPDHIKGFLDGEEWFSTSGGASSIRRNIQDMPSGHLTIQLDNFDGTSQTPATMEVAWARVYTLTPTGPVANAQTLGVAGIPTREAFGTARVTVAAAPDVEIPPPANSVPTRLGQNTVLGSMTLGWTLTTGGPGPGAQVVSGAGGIPSLRAVGVPSLNVPPGEQTISPSGIPPVTLFGAPTVSGGEAPAPAPGGTLVPALYAVGRDGTTLTPLPSWTSIKLSPVRNSMGSLEVTYPAGAPGFGLLHDGVSASPLRALEIRVWLGGNNSAALGGWLVGKAGDDLSPGESWSFSGHFHEWLLSKAIIYPQAISEANKNGELRFAGATTGLVFATLMDQAQARGALPMVTRDFTATHDSNGRPWAKAISSLKLAPKTTLLQVAEKLVELGMCEFELTPARMWRAYNPEGRGADRSTGTDPLAFTQTINLRERSRRESARDAGTAVLVAGSEGFYATASSATAQAELGWRAEVGVDAGQLDSASAVQAVAGSYLDRNRVGVAEYAAGVEFLPGKPLPLIDYGIGDWALLRVGTTYERQRIVQIELVFDRTGQASGSVEFNDLITDRVVALHRRLNAISSGDAVVGTSEPTPGGTGDDIIPPAAPVGVTVASTNAYQVPGETLTLADVSVGWAPVTEDAYADAETAGKARLSLLLAARVRAGLPIGDWTFYGQPSWAPPYAALLKKEWDDDPDFKDADTGNPVPGGLLAWLDAYEPAHRGGGAVAADVAQYVVQYQYLGIGTGGGIFDPLNPGDQGFWETPDNSPTTQNLLIFGNVEGGRAVGVRAAAVDRSGNQGPWSAVVAVDTASDDVPPPAPSRPLAAAWFRTMDITWDGKGASGEDMIVAAPDILSGGGVEVHVGTGIDFEPHRPANSSGVVDLSASSTYRSTLYAAGTTNVTGLTLGTTYYARFVAVDRSGNASEPSETSDGVLPKQLVNIDIGPDAVGRLQIIDGEIVRAKIADAAINSLKVEEINVGLLTAGTLNARVTLSERIQTPMVNGNQIQIDNGGIRLYAGNTVVGRWQVADASMLVTGTYLSGLVGERINILPDGSFRMYGAAGADYASIENDGGIVRMRSRADSTGRRSHVDYNPTGLTTWYGFPNGQVPAGQTQQRSKMDINLSYAVLTAPVTGIRVWRHISANDGTTPRFHFVTSTGTADDNDSVVHYERVALASNHGYIFGANSDAGIVYDAGFCAVTHNNITPAPIHASAFNQVSAIVSKRDITPVRFGELRAKDLVRAARARSFYYRSDFEPRPERPGTMLQQFDEDGNRLPDRPGEWTAPPLKPVMRVGPMADDLLKVAPEIVVTDLPRDGGLALGIGTIAGIAYAASGENADEIDDLRRELAQLRARLDGPDDVIEGDVVAPTHHDEEPDA